MSGGQRWLSKGRPFEVTELSRQGRTVTSTWMLSGKIEESRYCSSIITKSRKAEVEADFTG